jgi:uncharacterized protein DUF4145
VPFTDAKFPHLKGAPWPDEKGVPTEKWTCAYCNNLVASSAGWQREIGGVGTYFIRLCSHCKGPTFFLPTGEHFPSSMPGSPVPNLPGELGTLYDEARASAAGGANTAAVLVCRKILMNVAVQEGAPEGKTFVEYVEFLDNKGFVPPRAKGWVDYIRKKGNEANHEIALMTEEDAIGLIALVEKLLRDIYDFPNRVPKVAASEG